MRLGLMMAVLASSSGCLLTTDIPDPALDVPGAYKEDHARREDAPPALDWWRAFKSRELNVLMEEAQTVNLDIAAATARILQADAQARTAGSALLPLVSGGASATRSKSASSGGGTVTSGGTTTNASRADHNTFVASLSASYEIDFWGKNRDALLAAE